MATLTINIPDAVDVRVAKSYAEATGWTAEVADPSGEPGAVMPNPETRKQWFRRKVIEHIRGTVQGHERTTAEKAIATTADPGLT